MKEQLTIQELSAYLPYNLKAEMLDYKIDYVGNQYDEIIGVHQWDKLCLYWSALTVGGSKPNIERIKPLLLPLSSLTKEIEYKGEKFVPIERLEIEGFKIACNDFGITLHIDSDYSFGYAIDIYNNIFQKLAEWHIDFQNLIPRGLAIDKTTIL